MGLKEFKEKIIKDEAFAKKFEDVTSPEDLVSKASAEGFTFTVDDVKNNSELTEAELDAAAGGKSIFASTYFVNENTVFAKNYFVTK